MCKRSHLHDVSPTLLVCMRSHFGRSSSPLSANVVIACYVYSKVFSQENLNRKKDTNEIISINRKAKTQLQQNSCFDISQVYFGFYWKKRFLIFNLYSIFGYAGMIQINQNKFRNVSNCFLIKNLFFLA